MATGSSEDAETHPLRSLTTSFYPKNIVVGLATAICAFFGLCVLACEPDRDVPERPKQADVESSELDRLRSIGYLEFTDEVVQPGKPSVTIYDRARSEPGYNLFVSRNLSLAQLIDAQGRVMRSWSHRPSSAWSNAELTQEGDLLVQGTHRGDNYLLRFGFDGHTIWKRSLDAHHDVEVTPDGHLATLSVRDRVVFFRGRKRRIADHQIALLTPAGEFIRDYSLFDMMSASPRLFSFQRVAAKRGKIDLIHSNSVEFMHFAHLEARNSIYAKSNVIVSMRHQDAIAIFDLESEKLVWTWGQGEIGGPHDATILASGNVLLFDNGLGRGWSRVIELDPLRREIVWEYHAPEPADFYSASRGSNQRLPGGNTLIADSNSGAAFEVTPNGDVVWKFLNPNTNARGQRSTITRIKRYPIEWIDALLAKIELARMELAESELSEIESAEIEPAESE